MGEYYQVEGRVGGSWGVEQEYQTLAEARGWVRRKARGDFPWRIVKVSHEIVAEQKQALCV